MGTVGIVTADGTSMILSYNKKCNMTMDVNPQWDENQSTSTSCVAAIFDWNGGKKPNMFNHSASKYTLKSDIILFNAKGLGKECIVKLDGTCYTKLYRPTQEDALKYGYSWCAGENAGTISGSGISQHGTVVETTTAKDSDGISPKELGIQKYYYVYDYWNAAVKECGGTSKMITKENLALLVNEIYNVKITPLKEGLKDLTPVYGVASSYQLPEPSEMNFAIWSDWETTSTAGSSIGGLNAFIRIFQNDRSAWYNRDPLSYRYKSGYYALCKD